MNRIQKLAVIGGGSAGFVAALIIKTKFPHIQVDVIRSKKIGIIGVGEGSTEHWSTFANFIGVKPEEFVRECDATFKSGIMFTNWSSNGDYLQSVGAGYNQLNHNYLYMYAHMIANGETPKDLVFHHCWDSTVNTWFVGQEDKSPAMQYHFNTNKLNDYLTRIAIERGINVIDDEIIDVEVVGEDIGVLTGELDTYKYNFYIDSTGFKKLLIDKLGAKWRSHGKYLKMKSAIVFPREYTDNFIPMWTTARAMNAGWMFTIPVYDRTGNGYIFDSDFITAEEAKAEVETLLGHEITVGKQIDFDPGAVDRPWIGNCCAIGLSASFIEPLEASSIGTSINQTFLLCEKLINYTPAGIKKYNDTMDVIIDNIRDFIALHYMSDRRDTPFWRAVSESEIPDSLADQLGIFQQKLPRPDDFYGTQYMLFNAVHYILVMHGLGLFDINSIREEYFLTVNPEKQQEAAHLIQQGRSQPCEVIPHRTMLDIIRNLKKENK